MPEEASSLVLLPFLAAAVERTVEIVMAALPPGLARSTRRLIAVGLSLASAAAVAFWLELDLVGGLLAPSGLTATQGRALTALALAGGSAPVHALLTLIEEARGRLALNDPPSARLRRSGE